MSWTPQANRDDVLFASGRPGHVSGSFFRQTPPFAATRATGNASANVTEEGLIISGGGTAGDIAAVDTEYITFHKADNIPWRIFIGFQTATNNNSTMSTDDKTAIGAFFDIDGANEGLRFDLQTMEYRVESEDPANPRASASATDIRGRQYCYLVIDVDPGANETTFHQGLADETVTLNAVPDRLNEVAAAAKSEGNGENLYITEYASFPIVTT